MARVFKLLGEFVAAVVAVAVVAFVLLAWRVASEPIRSTALTPTIESALDGLIPGTRAEIASSLIVWDNADRSVALRGDGVKLRDNQNLVIAEVPSVEVKLSVIGMLLGRFVPAELDVEHPRFWLVRRADGFLSFGDQTHAATGNTPENNAPDIKNMMRGFINEAADNKLLSKLDVIGAEISVHDEATGHDLAVNIPEVSLHRKLNGGLTGKAQVEVANGDHVTAVQAHYAYDYLKQRHDIVVSFRDINPSFLSEYNPALKAAAMLDAPLTGEASLSLDEGLNVTAAALHVSGDAGRLVNADLWDAPLAINGLALDASYDLAARHLEIPNAQVDLGETRLSMSLDAISPLTPTPLPPQAGGEGLDRSGVEDSSTLKRGGSPSPPLGGERGWGDGEGANSDNMEFVVNLKLNDLPMGRFSAVWPKSVISPNARNWIVNNMANGRFSNGEVTVKGRFNLNDPTNAVLESGGGKISADGARLTYMDGMPAVDNVGAEASFDLDHMDVKLTGGEIGALKLLPSTIQITDFQKDIQNIIIPLKISGPVRDVIKLIDQPPLRYARAVGLHADDGDGRVDGAVELRFPLLMSLAMKDIGVKVSAQIADFGAKKLVPGLEVSQGALALALDKDGYTLEGMAALNKVPLQVKWRGNFGDVAGKPRNQAEITGNVGGEQWTQLGLTGLGKTKGTTQIDVKFAQPGKTLSRLSGELNFRQAGLQVDELGWKKPIGVPASLTFAADIPAGKNVMIKSLVLQGDGIKANGDAVLDAATMRVLMLDFKPLVVGRTNADLRFAQSADSSGELSFAVDGLSLDVTGLKGGNEPAKSDPRPKNFTLKLGKLYTSENGFIADVAGSARRDSAGWSAIELHGMADGGHKLDISLKPEGDRRVFSIASDDFGGALKGMGFTDTVSGGKLEINGESSASDPRTIEGKVKIGAFSVTGFPALARLLNAVSPFGFVDLITGETSFGHLSGDFIWRGDEVELRQVHSAGSVFGLNIDGRVDMNTGMANLNGTLVPFSFVNGIIGDIPLLGDVITGGEGQGIIAASYTVKGPLSDPDISVNPVSLLTPGFLRNMFFSGDDKTEKKPNSPPEK